MLELRNLFANGNLPALTGRPNFSESWPLRIGLGQEIAKRSVRNGHRFRSTHNHIIGIDFDGLGHRKEHGPCNVVWIAWKVLHIPGEGFSEGGGWSSPPERGRQSGDPAASFWTS